MSCFDLMEERFFDYGGKRIDYTLIYRKRESLEIAVHPDSSVYVKAPWGTCIERVEEKLRKRARWVIRQQNYFTQFAIKTPPRYYVNGETHCYLGRQYRLRIVPSDKNLVKLKHGYFYVHCKDCTNVAMIRELMRQWYQEKARQHFNESLARCYPRFRQYDISIPPIAIRSMKTRWGSLSPLGTMTLNSNIIKAPKECIDYVVTHELCHLLVRNHSPKFYSLLESVMPNWFQLKHKLELSLI